MGRHFKLKPKGPVPVKKEEKEEVKVVYDHRPRVETNQKVLEEFKKNMETPSPLWDGPAPWELSN